MVCGNGREVYLRGGEVESAHSAVDAMRASREKTFGESVREVLGQWVELKEKEERRD